MINAIYKSFENGILAQTRRWDVNKVKKETTWLICFLLSVYTLNISAGMNYTCWQNNSLQFLVEIYTWYWIHYIISQDNQRLMKKRVKAQSKPPEL